MKTTPPIGGPCSSGSRARFFGEVVTLAPASVLSGQRF